MQPLHELWVIACRQYVDRRFLSRNTPESGSNQFWKSRLHFSVSAMVFWHVCSLRLQFMSNYSLIDSSDLSNHCYDKGVLSQFTTLQLG